MAEYIKREAAIKAMEKADYTAIADDADSCKADYLREIIESVPAADVVPLVHERWDDSGRYTFPSGDAAVRCTNCGCALTESEYRLNNWNYCPVCGAKMDGGADNLTAACTAR